MLLTETCKVDLASIYCGPGVVSWWARGSESHVLPTSSLPLVFFSEVLLWPFPLVQVPQTSSLGRVIFLPEVS